ncbi:fibronectin type III domain-containing protein [Marinobacter sp. NFXS11]|uniref:fibronectin type III domain-containing protein n=1 Tax=Marinobacter sp. NFXS11 TaxID=2818432 RepID=UPI0032DF15D6
MTTSKPRHPPGSRFLIPLIAASFLLTACQEDSRATRTSSDRASEIANSRLDKATDGLMNTLGQAREPGYTGTEPKELTWTAPLTREDGSSLTLGEIAEFRVYYRLRHQESFRVIHIESTSTTRLSLAEMAPGAYEFAITTVDIQGLESRRSTPVNVDLI